MVTAVMTPHCFIFKVKKNISKKKKAKMVIMAFGTFDGLHKGHLNFFKQARKLTPRPFLVVSIARDNNVFKIKGRRPVNNENKRAGLVRSCVLVDKVVLGGRRAHIPHIVKEKPEIIVLGYDQKAYIKDLKKDLENKGISVRIVRLLPYREDIYKNNLLRSKRLI